MRLRAAAAPAQHGKMEIYDRTWTPPTPPPLKKDIANTSKSLFVINLIGLSLSVYAYHVSVSKQAASDYRAFCDLSPIMSCTRVLTSPYSTGFGIMRYLVDESSVLNPTNSVVGIVYYLISAALSFSNRSFVCKLQLTLSVISNFGSVYLAIVLIMLQDVCVVCVSTYFVNALIYLFLSHKVQLLNGFTHPNPNPNPNRNQRLTKSAATNYKIPTST